MTDLLVDDVEIDGRGGRAVLVSGGVIATVGPRAAVAGSVPPAALVLDGGGAALVPGLHDHHLHLFALASRAASVWCGPPDVASPAALEDRLRSAAAESGGEGWIRAIGWDDTVAGWPDRHTLDAAVAERPLRLQHRSGALWVLNSAAVEELGLDPDEALPEGVETGGGVPTGRFFSVDDWLRSRITSAAPSLRDVGAELASFGVTGVTDATATNGPEELAALAAAVAAAELPQRVMAMTRDPHTPAPAGEGVALGCVKVVLAEASLPGLDDLAARIRAAHDAGRRVAIHAVDRSSNVMAAVALAEAGALAGDRIEHASVAPLEVVHRFAELGVTVVTQYNFVAEHGDRYLATVEPPDQPWLYRGRAFVDAAVALAGGSDAPFGSANPWDSMAAAVNRRTTSGATLGEAEALTPEEALALFTATAALPGEQRRIAAGEAADLCLLDRTWATARSDLAAVAVAATVAGGRVIHRAP